MRSHCLGRVSSSGGRYKHSRHFLDPAWRSGPTKCWRSWKRSAPRSATAVPSDGLACVCGVRRPAARDPGGRGQLRDALAELGEHAAGQRRTLAGQNLPRLRSASRRALSDRIRLPLQLALQTGRSRAPFTYAAVRTAPLPLCLPTSVGTAGFGSTAIRRSLQANPC